MTKARLLKALSGIISAVLAGVVIWYLTEGSKAEKLDAKFEIPGYDVGLDVTFEDRSEGNPTARKWSFGDNSHLENERRPTHRYAAPGAYKVLLSIIRGSDTDTVERVVEVFNKWGEGPTVNGLRRWKGSPSTDPAHSGHDHEHPHPHPTGEHHHHPHSEPHPWPEGVSGVRADHHHPVLGLGEEPGAPPGHPPHEHGHPHPHPLDVEGPDGQVHHHPHPHPHLPGATHHHTF